MVQVNAMVHSRWTMVLALVSTFSSPNESHLTTHSRLYPGWLVSVRFAFDCCPCLTLPKLHEECLLVSSILFKSLICDLIHGIDCSTLASGRLPIQALPSWWSFRCVHLLLFQTFPAKIRTCRSRTTILLSLLTPASMRNESPTLYHHNQILPALTALTLPTPLAAPSLEILRPQSTFRGLTAIRTLSWGWLASPSSSYWRTSLWLLVRTRDTGQSDPKVAHPLPTS